jgi:hypothetical protein
MDRQGQERKPYPSDVSDAEWAVLEPPEVCSNLRRGNIGVK